MMLSGAAISAEDALALGLVDQVVPPEQLLEAARHTALELAAGKVARRRSLQLGMHMQVRELKVGLAWEASEGGTWLHSVHIAVHTVHGQGCRHNSHALLLPVLLFWHPLAQAAGEGFATSVHALQAAEADARRRMPGQGHYLALLQAVAAGLAEGAPTGLHKVGAAGWLGMRQALAGSACW